MKHSIVMKFLVLIVTGVALVVAIGCSAGIIALESAGLYVDDLTSLQDKEFNSIAQTIARDYAQWYAVDNMGNLPYVQQQQMYNNPYDRSDAQHWKISLWQGNTLLKDAGDLQGYTLHKQYTLSPLYPLVSLFGPNDGPATPDTDPTAPSAPKPSKPTHSSSMYQELVVPEDYLFYEQDSQWNGAGFTTYYLYYYQGPEYTVTVYMHPDVLDSSSMHLLTDIFPFRYNFITIVIVSILIFLAGLAYLCYSAGKTEEGEHRLGGLNALPLDVYLFLCAMGVWGCISIFRSLLAWVENHGPHPGNITLAGVNLFAIALLVLGFVYAAAAQLKQPALYWWHHSLLGFLCKQLARFFRLLRNGIRSCFARLPVIWVWLLIGCIMGLSLALSILWAVHQPAAIAAVIAAILVCAGITLYSGYALGSLLAGIRRMNEGDLSHKISTRYLFGNFRVFAQALNSLSETAMVAAENETRSERMKSELITNVSHDIKTPLTSIINFVDLLQKPHSAQEQAEYLQVLSRQAGRMKKLIEDLMELSKASSGNTNVSLQLLDPVETVNQALGEFSDKLEAAGLEPVFHHPEVPLTMFADGRLTWRVLSNLLGNAVKYAMPQTRLYLDMIPMQDTVVLSIKNISRQELNLSSQDLLERFIQGDSSRSNEGSGLGLNIAKNLMELQHGKLELTIDGDLFKAILTFPSKKS